MACRIGITTDPASRRKYWKGVHPRLRNWRIIKVCRSKSAAQSAETAYAKTHGCKAHPGGSGPQTGNWSVYHFVY